MLIKWRVSPTDGEQSKRLLESNLDEALNSPDTPKSGPKVLPRFRLAIRQYLILPFSTGS